MNSEQEKGGLVKAEQEVMGHLIEAWNGFQELPVQNTEDREDFRKSLHRLQDLLALRVVRRDHPDGWR